MTSFLAGCILNTNSQTATRLLQQLKRRCFLIAITRGDRKRGKTLATRLNEKASALRDRLPLFPSGFTVFWLIQDILSLCFLQSGHYNIRVSQKTQKQGNLLFFVRQKKCVTVWLSLHMPGELMDTHIFQFLHSICKLQSVHLLQ